MNWEREGVGAGRGTFSGDPDSPKWRVWFHKKRRSVDMTDEPVYSVYVHEMQVIKLYFCRKALKLQFEKLNPKIFSPPFLGITGEFLYKAFTFMRLLRQWDFLFFLIINSITFSHTSVYFKMPPWCEGRICTHRWYFTRLSISHSQYILKCHLGVQVESVPTADTSHGLAQRFSSWEVS